MITTLDFSLLGRRIEVAAKSHNLCTSTIRKKQQLIARILVEVPTLEPKEVKQFLNEGYSCKGKPFTVATRNTYRTELQWFFRYVLEQEVPVALQQILAKEPLTYPERLVPYEQFITLIRAYTSGIQQIAYLLLYHSGLRPHELLSLTANDFSIENAQILVITVPDVNPVMPSHRNKTGTRQVLVTGAIVPTFHSYLKEFLHDHRETERIFNWSSKSLSTMFCKIKKLYNQDHPDQPLTFRLYDLRHTYASHYAAKGMPDQLLRKTLGWSQDSRMPRTYIHLTRWDLVHYAQQNCVNSSSSDQVDPRIMSSIDLLDQETPFGEEHDSFQLNDTQENLPTWYKQFLSTNTNV